MTKYSIRDLDLGGRRVFVRVDFNVPIADGVLGDETRIMSALPTIRLALEQGATVVLASHLGRPKGAVTAKYSLRPVADRLAAILGRPVTFAADCVGPHAEAAVAEAHGPGGSRLVLLENLRFHAAEEANDAAFAAGLAALADDYVNDAFGAAHRAHASVAAITTHFPKAAAGLLMEKELTYLGMALDEPERPFVAILGGAKVSDKLEVIENLLKRVDRLLIGGAMAYTFFRALGLPVGRSLVEEDKLDTARTIITHAKARDVQFCLPVDHVVAAAIEAGAPTEILKVNDAAIGDRMGLDIGPETTRLYATLVADAKTIVWNGPMGVFETDAFAKGTLGVARAVAASTGTTIIGGGDSVAAINLAGVASQVTHISTGGGASLEFLGGRILPGVAALPDKG
ncbi:MAG: phosphoglycerate kinase [Vicinamibacterales bacterium]|nr:phosphoglycerate kinase [Vicinamibacterales bacterium]